MVILKKLLFGVIFLLTLTAFFYILQTVITSSNIIFSLSLEVFLQLLTLVALLLFSSLCFVVFTSLAMDWKLVSLIIVLSAFLPVVFIPLPAGLLLSIGLITSLAINYLLLYNKLSTYLTFQPTSLLIPTIKNTALLIILFISFGYYAITSADIHQNGFTIPDSLIDMTLSFVPQENLTGQIPNTTIPQIPEDQLNELKKNPQLLKQYGLDIEDLDTFTQITNNKPVSTKDLVKTTIKDQVQQLIKPYINYIPIASSVIFFLSLISLSSMLSIFMTPILWLLYFVMEKSHFIRFEKTLREVKKMVI